MQSDIKYLTDAIHNLHDNLKLQEGNVNTLLRSAQIQQSNLQNLQHKCEQEIMPRVNEMWENRSQFKGGYAVIYTLCGLLVGGAAVGGFVYMILKH